jgi:hypothetical protein
MQAGGAADASAHPVSQGSGTAVPSPLAKLFHRAYGKTWLWLQIYALNQLKLEDRRFKSLFEKGGFRGISSFFQIPSPPLRKGG